jgi:hypothetical protein
MNLPKIGSSLPTPASCRSALRLPTCSAKSAAVGAFWLIDLVAVGHSIGIAWLAAYIAVSAAAWFNYCVAPLELPADPVMDAADVDDVDNVVRGWVEEAAS